MVLGIDDPGVWLPYLLCIGSAALCVIWGIVNWNKQPAVDEPPEEIRHWAEEEDKIEEEL